MTKPRLRFKAGMQKSSNTDMKGVKVKASNYKQGYSNLRNIQDYVEGEQVNALRWPNSLSTYDKMFYDHDVKQGYYLSQIFVEKAFEHPDVSFNKDSPESEEAALIVKWNLNNMRTTLQECIRNAYSCKRYGFSILAKEYEKVTHGPYLGKIKYKLKKLSPRAQRTLNASEPFILKNGEVHAVRQDVSTSSYSGTLFKHDLSRFHGEPYVDIPRNRLMIFSYDSLNGNPLGCSVLQSIFKPWREKVLIADYQAIGTSKDIGGKYMVATS